MAISWLLYTNLQRKTQYVAFFTRTYKTKFNTDESFLLQDRKKVSISTLFQKVCLSWKLSPIINRRGCYRGVGRGGGLEWKCPARKKIKNLISKGGGSGRLLGTQEYVIIFQEWHQFLRTQKRSHFNLNTLILTLVVSLSTLSRYWSSDCMHLKEKCIIVAYQISNRGINR